MSKQEATTRPRGPAALSPDYRQVYERAAVGLVELTLGGEIALINPEGAGLLGYTPQELIGRSVLEITHPDDAVKTIHAFQSVVRGEVAVAIVEKRYLHVDGGVIWSKSRVSLLYDDAGQARGVIAVVADITELQGARERAEVLAGLGEALQAAQTPDEVGRQAMERLGPALQALSMLVVRPGPDRIELPTIWGELPEVIRAYMTRPGLQLGDLPVLWQVAQSGEALYTDDYRAVSGALDTFPPLGCAVEPIRTPGGALVGFAVAWRASALGPWSGGHRDLLRRAAATLGLALERARIAQELLQANAALQRSNTELERFAYITSHDLQEPIRTVVSFAGLLEQRYAGVLDERGRRYLDMTLLGTMRLKLLVDDLLAYSRLSGDRVRLAPLGLAGPLSEALARLDRRLEDAGAQITHDELPTVTGDGPQLAQLFQNLLGNAVKFQRPGVAPEVHIGVAREAGHWHLSVRDNGIGIEEEYLERIFVLFQRLHTREQYEGSGLGLGICQKIVERHGGRLWAESTPGQGSTFHFTLPAGAGD